MIQPRVSHSVAKTKTTVASEKTAPMWTKFCGTDVPRIFAPSGPAESRKKMLHAKAGPAKFAAMFITCRTA